MYSQIIIRIYRNGQKGNTNDVIELTNQLNNEILKLQSKINSNTQNMNYLEEAMNKNILGLDEVKLQ